MTAAAVHATLRRMLPSRRAPWIIAVVVILGAGVLIAFATRPAWNRSSSKASPAAAIAPSEGLPFIADDYTQAVALARERKLPLFIESWAPW